jgi:hypothetical protein
MKANRPTITTSAATPVVIAGRFFWGGGVEGGTETGPSGMGRT